MGVTPERAGLRVQREELGQQKQQVAWRTYFSNRWPLQISIKVEHNEDIC